MKKHLALVAGVAMLSSSAFATKARMDALGQGLDGSYYIMDTRSVFLNPAALAENSRYMVLEWGQNLGGAGAAPGTTNVDGQFAPNAEGGFFTTAPWGHGHYAWGLYLGREDNEANGACGVGAANLPTINCVGRSRTSGIQGAGANTVADFLTQDNRVDLFFAGNHHSGLTWGANVWYAHGDDDRVSTVGMIGAADRTMKASGVALGLSINNFSSWLHWGLEDMSRGATNAGVPVDKYTQKDNWKFGASYVWKKYTFVVEYEKRAADMMIANINNDESRSMWKIGTGYQKKLNSSTKFFADIWYTNFDAEFKRTPNANVAGLVWDHDAEGWAVPLALGFEAKANSWLVLRGSISQKLLQSERHTEKMSAGADFKEKEFRTTGSTNVNVGATLKLGSVELDGLIGTGHNTAAAGNTASEVGILSLDNLMSRVGLHYHF